MAVETKVTINATGTSGTQYQFEVYPKSYNWNAVAGVYLVLRRNAKGNYDPIYIGETEDLGDRFSNHHKATCFEKHSWTHLAFLFERDSRRRLAIEQDLLSNFNWVCND